MSSLKWFKFDPSKWIMGRISRMPDDVQVGFIRLCCKYWNDECLMTINNARLEIGNSSFEKLVDFQVIKLNEDFIDISFLDEQFNSFESVREKRSLAGTISAKKRAKKAKHMFNTSSTHVDDNSTHVQQSSTDKIIVDKKEEKENMIDSRKLKFASTLKPFVEKYGKEMIREFYEYWTEPNKSNTKFRQELEKTWSLERRLDTWASNQKSFEIKKPTQITWE